MLGKLIKYDLMADWKKYSALYAATLLVSIMLAVTIEISEKMTNNRFLELMEIVFASVFMVLISAILILTIAFTVMRFYNNVMKDEGYLTHTLPVHTWQIMLSKLISSYIWFLSAVIVGCICIGLSAGKPLEVFRVIIDGLNNMMDSDRQSFAILAAMVILSPFFLLSHIYFCFALGNLSSSRKMGTSVLAFFGINIAENILSAFAIEYITLVDLQKAENIMYLTLAASFLFAVGYFFAAERIFAKKLNLE
ncbi:MAG: hypothetical protein K2J11_05455 [Oscillospiraceae bacterium]|nr:hypothetical protein [Oscillospiraceae bacterium]